MARSKVEAIEILDEVDNAEGCPIWEVRDAFMVHFKLTDDGNIKFENFGELTWEWVWGKCYPSLDKVFHANADRRAAVLKERARVKLKKAKDPRTEFGRAIQAKTGMPTSLIERTVERVSKEALRKFKGKGKPS